MRSWTIRRSRGLRPASACRTRPESCSSALPLDQEFLLVAALVGEGIEQGVAVSLDQFDVERGIAAGQAYGHLLDLLLAHRQLFRQFRGVGLPPSRCMAWRAWPSLKKSLFCAWVVPSLTSDQLRMMKFWM